MGLFFLGYRFSNNNLFWSYRTILALSDHKKLCINKLGKSKIKKLIFSRKFKLKYIAIYTLSIVLYIHNLCI